MKKLLSQDEIRDGCRRLAEQLRAEYEGRPLTIVAILTGSLVLLADLIRQLEMPLRVAMIGSRHQSDKSSSRRAVVIDPSLMPAIDGRDVLVIDDIFDTGHTLVEVIAQLAAHRPASIRSAVLLRKAGRREVAIEPDFVGFEIPDEFVVGYGLDYDDRYRNLPYVAALDPGDLTSE